MEKQRSEESEEKGRRKKIREEKGAEPFGEMRDQQWPDCNKLPEGFSSN
jgi:hypothetical protein